MAAARDGPFEPECVAADQEDVARLQLLRPIHACAVDEDAVGAAEIFDDDTVCHAKLRVPARHVTIVEHDGAAETTADHRRTAKWQRSALVYKPKRHIGL